MFSFLYSITHARGCEHTFIHESGRRGVYVRVRSQLLRPCTSGCALLMLQAFMCEEKAVNDPPCTATAETGAHALWPASCDCAIACRHNAACCKEKRKTARLLPCISHVRAPNQFTTCALKTACDLSYPFTRLRVAKQPTDARAIAAKMPVRGCLGDNMIPYLVL